VKCVGDGINFTQANTKKTVKKFLSTCTIVYDAQFMLGVGVTCHIHSYKEGILIGKMS